MNYRHLLALRQMGWLGTDDCLLHDRCVWHSRGIEVFGVRSVIDPDGYRPNVGIILMRDDGSVFWARRVSRDGWQFPQGGMNTDETPLEAMYRELQEETGLESEHVELLGATPGWLRYRLPRRCVRHGERPVCLGQKQVWFLLRLTSDDTKVKLDATDKPEFSEFRWVQFWYPLDHVVRFKRDVYLRALSHLAPVAHGLAGEASILSQQPESPLPMQRAGPVRFRGMGLPVRA